VAACMRARSLNARTDSIAQMPIISSRHHRPARGTGRISRGYSKLG
jgi:hypothetical protein